MNDQIHRQLLGFIVVAVVAALLLPSLFGGKEDLWGNWIYDYQTLITGLLALGAAFITVTHMQRSDAESDRRHRQLLDLQLGPAKIKIGRLNSAAFDNLFPFCKKLTELPKAPELKTHHTFDPDIPTAAKIWARDVEFILSDLKGRFPEDEWAVASDFVSVELNDAYRHFRSDFRFLERTITSYRHASNTLLEGKYTVPSKIADRVERSAADADYAVLLLTASIERFLQKLRLDVSNYEAVQNVQVAREATVISKKAL